MVKTFLGYTIATALMIVFLVTGKTDGVIEFKMHKVRFADTVYYFIIKDKPLEVSKYNYNKYKINDYFKQGIMQ